MQDDNPAAEQKALADNAISNFSSRADCKGLAIVTGACSGMGLAFAAKAAAQGMVVVVLDIADGKFAEVEAQLKAAGAKGG